MHDLRAKRVAIYARYSSANQHESSIEDQVRRCTEHVERAGGAVEPSLVFADYAVSAASLQRPAFEKLWQLVEAKPRNVDAIVTEDIDRISREFADAADLYRRLRYLEVPLLGVADGMDTSRSDSKLTFHVKALFADLYLDTLRDKTKRGLEGRALKGFSTGGLPTGYRSVPVNSGDDVVGHRIEIDPERAELVRRIFRLYAQGYSYAGVAKLLHSEGVPSPRAHTKHRRKGWVDTTIRAILMNEAYVGRWTYGKRQWRKVPGTNCRRPRERADIDVMRFERPELRIVDDDLWNAVQRRLEEVRACYWRNGDTGKGHLATRSTHPLSGLLRCGVCGGSMTMTAGSSARYYGCTAARKRGTCENKLKVREDVARARILGALRELLTRPAAIKHLRQRIAEGLGKLGRESTSKLREHEQRLARTQARIAKLVDFISDGGDSESVRLALKDLEAQARTERGAIEALTRAAAKPIRLPSVDAIVRRALDVEAMVSAEPRRGREALKRFFEGGHIDLVPRDGVYLAKSRVLALALLRPMDDAGHAETPPSPTWSNLGCAGWI